MWRLAKRGVSVMSNKKTFFGGLLFTLIGASLLLYMMHEETWMTQSSTFESNSSFEYNDAGENVEWGLYQVKVVSWGEKCPSDSSANAAQCTDLEFQSIRSFEQLSDDCEEIDETDKIETTVCEIPAAGELGHWFFISAIGLSFIALILAIIGIPGYMRGWVPLLLNAIVTLVVVVGAASWLVAFPDLNAAYDIPEDGDRFSPSYAFYLSIVSSLFFFIGGIVWGGIEAFNLEDLDDDLDYDEEDWQDMMNTSSTDSADWRRQTPVSYATESHQEQQQNLMQQYEYQDQSYHHRQTYENAEHWQRSAPRSQPSPVATAQTNTAPRAPVSGPPQAMPTPRGPSPSPQSAQRPSPPGPQTAQRPSPPGPQTAQRPSPPGPQTAQRMGPPGSTYGQPRTPKVRKTVVAPSPQQTPVTTSVQSSVSASVPSAYSTQSPAATVPATVTPSTPVHASYSPTTPTAVSQQPVSTAAPVTPTAQSVTTVQSVNQPIQATTTSAQVSTSQPVSSVQSTQSLQQYIAPHQMPVSQSSLPPSEVSGTVRPDGWEILEWPSGSGKWFWKNKNTGQWSAWT